MKLTDLALASMQLNSLMVITKQYQEMKAGRLDYLIQGRIKISQTDSVIAALKDCCQRCNIDFSTTECAQTIPDYEQAKNYITNDPNDFVFGG